jgi:hypothetical protein
MRNIFRVGQKNFKTYASYGNNYAITREVTQDQWDELIDFSSDNNYYIFLEHNCTTIAREGWSLMFDDDLTSELALDVDTPAKLKECLKDRGGFTDYLSRIKKQKINSLKHRI